MFRKISFLILILFLNNLCFSQTLYPGNYAPPNDPELKNLVWNKWNTNNFTILSIDQSQGEYLYKNIEAIKTWSIIRWGFEDIKYSAECRIFCVPNKNIMKKLFGRETSTTEVILENNKIKISAIWFIFDGQPIDSIPANLVQINLKEIEQASGTKISFWFYRGSLVLNHSTDYIKNILNNGTIDTDTLSVTESQWAEFNQDKKNKFDFQAAFMCLLLRKEFGQNNTMKFIVNSDPKIIGFRTNEEFNATFVRYCNNLVLDVRNGKTPESYLLINKR